MTNIMVDIKIIEKSYVEQSGFSSSVLTLHFKGKDINFVILNTLRRIAMDDIAMYAFMYIDIEANTSIYNNDMMRMRLKQIPIYDVSNNIDYLQPEFWKGIDYNNKHRKKHNDEIAIDGYINVVNDTNDILNVTTDHMTYIVADKKMRYPSRDPKYPLLLIQLRPNETFKCHMRGVLGIGELDSVFSGCKRMYYNYEDDIHDLELTIESTGQIHEYEILIKCCKYAKIKLKMILSDLEKRFKSGSIKPDEKLNIKLENEDFTMGNIINDALQSHENIKFSGIIQPNHLVKSVEIKCYSDSFDSLVNAIYESFEKVNTMFDFLENKFKQMWEKK